MTEEGEGDSSEKDWGETTDDAAKNESGGRMGKKVSITCLPHRQSRLCCSTPSWACHSRHCFARESAVPTTLTSASVAETPTFPSETATWGELDEARLRPSKSTMMPPSQGASGTSLLASVIAMLRSTAATVPSRSEAWHPDGLPR